MSANTEKPETQPVETPCVETTASAELAQSAPTSQALRRKAIIDRVAVLSFGLAWVAALFRLAPQLDDNVLMIAGPVGILGGYLVADFLAGTVHWLADRYFDPRTPILGPMLIAPFREHHKDPMSISRHDFFEVSGNSALVSLPLPLLLFALPASDAPASIAMSALAIFGLSLSLASVATNLFHGWAHAESPPRLSRWLQRLGLILTPDGHALHHNVRVTEPAQSAAELGGHDRAYCVTSGWLNPLLDRIHFFERIEQRIPPASTRPATTD